MSNNYNNPLKPTKVKPIQQRTLRYKNEVTAADDVSITRGDLLNFLVAVTDSSTVAIPIIEAVKIRRVRIVAFSEGDATDTGDVCLKWNGDRSPSTCTSISFTVASPAVINQLPPKDSLAKYWSLKGSDEAEILFTIEADNGDIVLDIHVDYLLLDGAATTETLASAATFTGIVAVAMPNDTFTSYVPVSLTATSFA